MSLSNNIWRHNINVRDYIIENYTPYDGDDSFLSQPTERTNKLWEKTTELLAEERDRGGVYDIDERTISTICAFEPGYIDRELEQIVGIQTDEPLKRAIMPFGGIRTVKASLEAYDRKVTSCL